MALRHPPTPAALGIQGREGVAGCLSLLIGPRVGK